jgi:hypothetical protein
LDFNSNASTSEAGFSFGIPMDDSAQPVHTNSNETPETNTSSSQKKVSKRVSFSKTRPSLVKKHPNASKETQSNPLLENPTSRQKIYYAFYQVHSFPIF